MLEKTLEMNYLYDFYSGLLTEKQRLMLNLYYNDDLSLGEIGELHKVSRQAVSESIRRAEEILRDLEVKLQLKEKHLTRISTIKALTNELESFPVASAKAKPYLEKLLD